MAETNELLGAKCIRITAYHPSSNGLVENFHRQLKAALKATPETMHWVSGLGIHASLKQDIECSVAVLQCSV